MGFQDVHEIVHIAASRKGGKIKVTKGLGAMSEEKRRKIASMGGKARYANRSEPATEQGQEDRSGSAPRLGDLLGDLDG